MAAVNIPNATPLPSPSVSVPGVTGSGAETIDPGNPASPVDISGFSALPYPNYSGGGGGPTRPASGQMYPRGL